MRESDAIFLVHATVKNSINQKVKANGGESLNISWLKFNLSGCISVFTNLSTNLLSAIIKNL